MMRARRPRIQPSVQELLDVIVESCTRVNGHPPLNPAVVIAQLWQHAQKQGYDVEGALVKIQTCGTNIPGAIPETPKILH